MKPAKTGPQMWDLDGDGRRWAFSINGYVQFCGTYAECEKRMLLATPPDDRARQDQMLGRGMSMIG